ncbi:MAG: RNA polymerase sigma factor [Blastocatellia bacterium]
MIAQTTQLRAVPESRPADTGTRTVEKPIRSDLESVYREHHDRIFRLAYRVTGNPTDAEDVLQTVFLRLSRREKIDLEPNPAAYLNRAAVNAALDLLRQRGRRPLVQVDDLNILAVDHPHSDPESISARQELREVIRRAVAGLGEKSATMFVLKYFEGYGNREIAELMGTSPMVVGVLLHRARARVRGEVSGYLGRMEGRKGECNEDE